MVTFSRIRQSGGAVDAARLPRGSSDRLTRLRLCEISRLARVRMARAPRRETVCSHPGRDFAMLMFKIDMFPMSRRWTNPPRTPVSLRYHIGSTDLSQLSTETTLPMSCQEDRRV